ncbi:IclR family transcriptional regulator [Acrocarpospora macrocephala]|uniref:Glycerol operon regulatory protein n=1 Tax=Acrocarpospora macrocephala TaxID=150177 RepID=A0A5M3WJT0_9ACTN|nr:IclR family transcriptional regulator [Acrocarpospora macrocephala]GES09465.1 IclR family transcriptional regulator [Acrocarpospora macrocephala]
MRNESEATSREERGLGSVANALRLLETMARVPQAGVSELARALHLSKASMDRLLSTFTRAGFAEQDPATRKYRLTVKIVALAESVRSRIGLVEIARPHLTGLAEQVHEAVNLGVYLDGGMVYLDSIPSRHTFQIEARPGVMLPAYCTGAGKAILAFSRPEVVESYLAGVAPVAHTRFTLTSVSLIREELESIRRAGFAEDKGELLEEACCAAAPVPGPDGYAVAALSVTAPRSRYSVRRAELISAVTAAAERVTAGIAAAGITAPGRTNPAPPLS